MIKMEKVDNIEENARLEAKYPNNFCSVKKEIINIASNKTISPVLPGLDFASLKLLANSEFPAIFFNFMSKTTRQGLVAYLFCLNIQWFIENARHFRGARKSTISDI